MRPSYCARPGATRTSLASSLAARPPWRASTRSSRPRWHRRAASRRSCGPRSARSSASGHLSPRGKSPYGRLETRFYADTAGLAHAIEPYPRLIEQCILVSQQPAFPPTTEQAYEITHTSFYITDFGGSSAGGSPAMLTAARDLIRRVLAHAVREALWDLAAELLLAWACLGGNPAGTDEGQAAMASLARAQLPDGSIPGRSAATRAASAPGTLEFFSTAYHTTLVTALMSLVIGAGRRVLATSEGR